MWLLLGFASAFFLGLYDVEKKRGFMYFYALIMLGTMISLVFVVRPSTFRFWLASIYLKTETYALRPTS